MLANLVYFPLLTSYLMHVDGTRGNLEKESCGTLNVTFGCVS